MCLSNMGKLHIAWLTMPLTLSMRMRHHHAISNIGWVWLSLTLFKSMLMKCWIRAGYALVCCPMEHQSCLYIRKWESCVCVLTSAASTIIPGLTCSQCHVFMTCWIRWVMHVHFLLSTCCLHIIRYASRRGTKIALLFSYSWVYMNMLSYHSVLLMC